MVLIILIALTWLNLIFKLTYALEGAYGSIYKMQSAICLIVIGIRCCTIYLDIPDEVIL